MLKISRAKLNMFEILGLSVPPLDQGTHEAAKWIDGPRIITPPQIEMSENYGSEAKLFQHLEAHRGWMIT